MPKIVPAAVIDHLIASYNPLANAHIVFLSPISAAQISSPPIAIALGALYLISDVKPNESVLYSLIQFDTQFAFNTHTPYLFNKPYKCMAARTSSIILTAEIDAFEWYVSCNIKS